MAAALAAQLASAEVVRSAEAAHSHTVPVHAEAVRSHTAAVHAEVARSHMAVDFMEAALTEAAHTEGMVAWVVAVKPKAPACAPQHSSYVAPPS